MSSGPCAAIFGLCRGKIFDLVTSKAILRDCCPAGCHAKSSTLVLASIRTANLFANIAPAAAHRTVSAIFILPRPPANGRLALLRFRSQSILSFLTEDADANREVVCRWSRHHSYFLYFSTHFGERAAVRAEAVFRDALALHWALSRRPHCCHLRRAAPTQRVLHGRRQRRCLEDHRFWKHLESDFRRPANRLRRRACHCSVRSEYHRLRQWRRLATPRSRHRRWRVQINRRRKILDAPRPPRRPANHGDTYRPERFTTRFRRR